MPRVIALLRGINVGGNTMVKMADLKAAFEECGFENVATYINSGNLAFDTEGAGRARVRGPHVSNGSPGVESTIGVLIEQAIETTFNKQIPVMVREQTSISQILANNPFEGEFESHKEMHVLFLCEEMPAEMIERLLAAAPTGERFAVMGREIYCHLPLGVAASLLGKSFIEKKLRVAVTARNWRTVQKLAEL